MSNTRIPYNTSLRDTLRIAADLGCTWRCSRHDGALIISHPSTPVSVRISLTAKDCPRGVTGWLRKLQKGGRR